MPFYGLLFPSLGIYLFVDWTNPGSSSPTPIQNPLVCVLFLSSSDSSLFYFCHLSGPLCHLVCSLQTERYSAEDTLCQYLKPVIRCYFYSYFWSIFDPTSYTFLTSPFLFMFIFLMFFPFMPYFMLTNKMTRTFDCTTGHQ